MKIKHLRFQNLNSLVGEWSIDFDAPEFTSEGLFAIIGPTGAGKSTILDAICLALYGRTPRIPNISAQSNEIMSRQQGVCFAELVFETSQGRYMAYWSQRRARDRADGRLQQPRHELSDADSKTVLTSQIMATRAEIENKTGMDYNRFVQSMMLAQGGFAVFLQASGDERAPILEQITGTAIYSHIGMYVHERLRTEKQILEQFQAEMRGIALLSAEQEQQLQEQHEEKKALVVTLANQHNTFAAQLMWLETMANLRSELNQLAEQEEALAQELEAFRPERERLLSARRAANLEVDYVQLQQVRSNQQKDSDNLAVRQQQEPSLAKAVEEALKAHTAAGSQHAEAAIAHEGLLKNTKQVRLLDHDIGQGRHTAGDQEQHIAGLREEASHEEEKKKGLLDGIDGLRKEKAALADYLDSHPADARIDQELAGIRPLVARLGECRQAVATASAGLAAARRLHDKAQKAVAGTTKKLTEAGGVHAANLGNTRQATEALAALLKGETAETLQYQRDTLMQEVSMLRQVADFDEVRKTLEDGNPCPLCGANDHPYARGNVPTPNEAEVALKTLDKLLSEYRTMNARVEELREHGRQSERRKLELSSNHQLAAQALQQAATDAGRRETELKQHQATFAAEVDRLEVMLSPFGVGEPMPGDEEGGQQLLATLVARRDTWLANQQRSSAIDAEIREREAEVRTSERLLAEKARAIEAASAVLERLNKELADKQAEREQLFGSKDTAEEESQSASALRALEEARSKAYEAVRSVRQQLDDNVVRMQELTAQIADRAAVLARLEQDFGAQWLGAGFASEADFNACRIPSAGREALEQQAAVLDSKGTELKTMRRDKEGRLAAETAKALTSEEADTVQASLDEAKALLDAATQQAAAVNAQLDMNATNRGNAQQLLERIATQQKVSERWQRLHTLIGSADGKKYRNFAQGLTLEIMVSHANQQLRKLSDRYLLIRDREQPLELNVVDNYQAGEIRSTKNLSGGESFIVSLALALGLSGMSSQNIRVDSLFLDEGFGTLDEDALEMALATLAGLRQDGKMIGLISHVPAIRERINTRIMVQPVREGRSELSGPGCKGY